MKALIITLLALSLSACAGYRSSSIQYDPVTKKPVKTAWGTYARDKVKKTEAVALLDSLAPAVAGAARQQVQPCDNQPLAEISKLSEAGQTAYYASVSECHRGRSTANMMAYALGRPTDAIGEIAQSYAQVTRYIQQGKSNRVGSVLRGVTSLGLAGFAYGATKAVAEGFRDGTVAAAENSGDISVGSISTSSGSSIGPNSNDVAGSASAAGEAGLGGTANGTSTTTNTASGAVDSPTIISIGGRGNKAFASRAQDTGRVFNESDQNLLAEPSSNAAQLNDSRSSGLLNADENNQSPLESQDNDSGSLF